VIVTAMGVEAWTRRGCMLLISGAALLELRLVSLSPSVDPA